MVVLGGGALACADCGQAVERPEPAHATTAKMIRDGRATPVQMTRCDACAERDRSAVELAQRHLRLGVTFDGRRYSVVGASELLVEARLAFDAAGIDSLPAESAANPAAALSAEIFYLGLATSGLRWQDRLNAPTSIIARSMPLVAPGTANCRRWAHVEPGRREEVRDLIGRALMERVARYGRRL